MIALRWKDFNSIRRTHIKRLVVVICICITMLGRRRQADFWGLLARQLESPSRGKRKMDNSEGQHSRLFSDLYKYTPTFMCTSSH